MADIYIGNIKGPQGDTGATGPQGAAGDAATIQVGTVSTTAYGNPAQVNNSGTEHAAVFNFVIPQGAPGVTVTQLDNLALNTITTSTDQYPQIQVGDIGRVIFGKIIKFFQDLVTGLAAKVNYSDALTMEEIEASSDLTDKVSAAAASKSLKDALSSFALTDSRDMSADTTRGLNSESGYGDVTLSKGFYLLISETSVGANYSGRTFARFKGSDVYGLNTFMPPTINGYGYMQIIQFINVTTSATVGRYYFDTVQTASNHLWRVYKLFG